MPLTCCHFVCYAFTSTLIRHYHGLFTFEAIELERKLPEAWWETKSSRHLCNTQSDWVIPPFKVWVKLLGEWIFSGHRLAMILLICSHCNTLCIHTHTHTQIRSGQILFIMFKVDRDSRYRKENTDVFKVARSAEQPGQHLVYSACDVLASCAQKEWCSLFCQNQYSDQY